MTNNKASIKGLSFHLKVILYLFIISSSLLLSGCFGSNKSFNDHINHANNSSVLNSGTNNISIVNENARYENNRDMDINDLEEYVSRVGKRLLIVIDNQQQNYKFVVSNSSKISLTASKTGEITISHGLLKKLTDEAELAAVLSHTMVSLNNTSLYLGQRNLLVSEFQAIEMDKFGMVYMSRAGYDPKAAVELQEIYLTKNDPRHGHWLKSIYISHPPTLARLAASKNTITKLPSGLLRGKERYNRNIF